jgi:hypothetical protein
LLNLDLTAEAKFAIECGEHELNRAKTLRGGGNLIRDEGVAREQLRPPATVLASPDAFVTESMN